MKKLFITLTILGSANLGFNQDLMVEPDKSLTSSLSFSRNDYVNDLNTGSNSNKDITKSSLNLIFNNQDKFFSGGANTLSLTGTYGALDLTDNISSYDTDQLTARTDGEYWKLALNMKTRGTTAQRILLTIGRCSI